MNNNGTPNNPADDFINYTPNANFNGPDTLVYQICDANNDCDTALVVLTISPVNDLPDAVNDAATTPEDTPVTIPVLTNDTFGGDGPGTADISIVVGPANGTLTILNTGDNNPANDQIVYTPNPNFTGTNQFTYAICDANGDCHLAGVTINVTPVNDPPVAVNDPATTPEDTPVTVCVLTNDSDVEGPLAGSNVMVLDGPDHGTFTLNPVIGCVTYTPAPNYKRLMFIEKLQQEIDEALLALEN